MQDKHIVVQYICIVIKHMLIQLVSVVKSPKNIVLEHLLFLPHSLGIIEPIGFVNLLLPLRKKIVTLELAFVEKGLIELEPKPAQC